MKSNNIEKEIEKAVAHIMAFYGDQPDKFLYKMTCLVYEWYCKGLKLGIKTEEILKH
ncbi:hypothetical protein [Legionella maceachernii]|uniref:Uncharacterized protein n=1 Tax=Legionella maceachernii TaxID=466 RepID=A0A0W0WBK1_9GAMM|nr:hypothetical protein [Legionella maceachernii]KTD29696.1 hypothetical protein Lmac_0871 [Legionella maceachernii]SKA21304.1 hypothetical protein SAMN02745128_02615 [Legionella maceachernii]SUP02554.1 Uncharacterised protein [Legionella maceachernii]